MCLLFICLCNLGFSQEHFFVQNKKKSDKISFNLINNLIVIPVEINGVELSFLLDTGVSRPIIFNFLNISDSLRVNEAETIFLKGLGEGEPVKALKSRNNIFKVGDAIKLNQDLFAILDIGLNFTPRLGTSVHGILGYDLFKDLIVEINYSKKYIKLTDPSVFSYNKCKTCERLNLEFYNNKPYIKANITVDSGDIPVKLLIDSGSSDALWLFENDTLGINTNGKYFEDFLGHGLSGSIYGKRSVIKTFNLKKINLNAVNVAFPDSSSLVFAKRIKGRNGSLGGCILKRYNTIIDYQNALITLKKNRYFKEKFNYNRAGIALAHDGVRLVKENNFNAYDSYRLSSESKNDKGKIVFKSTYKQLLAPVYSIVELRKDSAADKVGLQVGDVILSINGKPAQGYTLQQLTLMFYKEEGKRIKLKVERKGVILVFGFELENVFK